MDKFDLIIQKLDKMIELLEDKQNNAITFEEWYNQWFNLYKKPKLKPSSLKGTQLTYNKYLSRFAKRSLSSLTALEIQSFLNSIELHRAKTITYGILNNMFTYAVKNEIIIKNPCNVVDIKNETNKGRALDIDEQNDLRNFLNGNDLENLILAYLNTGCRRCELISISWSDIDFKNKTININKNYDTVLKKVVDSLKTKNSTRVIPLTSEMEKIIKKLDKNIEYPFFVEPLKINKEFKKIVESLSLDNVTVHSLRHTFATNCIRVGIPMKQVQLWLGHSKYSTTADIYTDIDFSMFRDNAMLLERL